ncbi:G-D-S-L family lipolytic protein [Tenacibaculum sp.]|uniref:G-D-S-L family lipolytic protein n=1 Tax=Tenacibaculum sp. TaxID=1906242 RepID=UPI003D11A7CE
MKNTVKYTFLSALFLGFVACDVDNNLPEIKGEAESTIALSAGSADFSKYVAIGASFTAGFTDNALFKTGQENSFPNTLAKKFAMVGGGNFTQPLMNDNYGGLILAGNPVLHPVTGERLFDVRLTFNGEGPISLSNVNPAAISTTDFALNNPTGPFNNVGVPGAKSTHFIAPGYGNLANFPAAANPYAVRVAGNTDASIIELAVSQSPTFFTLSEFGGNDVLGYAISGGDGSSPITATATFDFALGTVETALKATGAKGVVANLPYITSLPHFTTVPYAPLDPSNPSFGSQIPTLNNVFGAINGVFAALGVPERSIVFATDAASAVVIKDESLVYIGDQMTQAFLASPTFPPFVASFGLPTDNTTLQKVAGLLGAYYGQARQATADDLLVLPSKNVIGEVNTDSVQFLMAQGLPQQLAGMFSVEGVSLPLEDKWVLVPSEQAEIQAATDAYNTSLKTMADANGYAFVDFKAILQEASTVGLEFGRYNMNTSLVTGGLVGLDGIHLTGRGYALMANKMLAAIDATYGSNFSVGKNGLAKPDNYPTNYSPTLQ